MKSGVDFKELKEIEKRILEGIKLEVPIYTVKTIAGFDITYLENEYFCVGVVINLETKEELERKEVNGIEIIPYSPNLVAFREGPVIVNAYRALDIKPDILFVKGMGAVNEKRIGLASYVGVMVNKPCIGVSKDLAYGKLVEDKIMFEGKQRGIAIRTKEFSNPVYIMPGHNINLDNAIDLVKKLIDKRYKMPLPLHLAHKYVNKHKKNYPNSK